MELINNNGSFTFSHCENKGRFFVTDFLDINVTNLHLNFDEAKALYDAIDIAGVIGQSYDYKKITRILKKCRKENTTCKDIYFKLIEIL